MRVLCLHGVGTNGSIMDSQTVAFRSLLPQDWDWQFVDGEEESDPAPGVDSVYPGPYSCYYVEPSTKNLQDALDLVYHVMDEEGPFDAIMGFSQGGALAASLLLKHQIENPFDPPPFRLAVFLCASLPFSWTAEHGFDVTTLMLLGQAATGDFAQWQHASAQNPATPSDATLLSLPIQQRVQAQKRIEALQSSSGESCLYRRFHPEDDAKTRIQIPTVHVIGARDEMFREQQVKLAELCDERMAETGTHAKGHEVPREACQDIARAIQKAATRAEFMV